MRSQKDISKNRVQLEVEKLGRYVGLMRDYKGECGGCEVKKGYYEQMDSILQGMGAI